MATCIPTTKSCETISNMIGGNSYGTFVQTVINATATHRVIGFTRDQKEWLKDRLHSIGAKYIRFTLAVDRRYIVGLFALPITPEELAAKNVAEAASRNREEKVTATKRDVKLLAEALGCRSSDYKLDGLSHRICSGAIDCTKMINAYLKEPKQPVGRDEMRIYDIIRKSQEAGSLTFCVANADWFKMCNLATQMNNKIKDESKRRARHDACIRYGLLGVARHFT